MKKEAAYIKKAFVFVLSALFVFSAVACDSSASQSVHENDIPLPGEDLAVSSDNTAQGMDTTQPLPLAGLNNPLTGLPGLEGFVDGQRPVAVTLTNELPGSPLRGVSGCDVFIEGPNERGSTTVLAMFGDFRTVPQVGPVGTASDPFLQLALPYNSIFVHTGLTSYASNLLNALSYQDINGTYVGTTGFIYDSWRATDAGGNRLNDYCWYTDANLIWNAATALALNPVGEVHMLFNFTPSQLPDGEEAYEIQFAFNAATPIKVYYDKATGLYSKTAFGMIQADETGAPLLFDNVFILFGGITQKADSLFLEYDFSSGSGYYFQGGSVTSLSWQKGGPTDALRLFGEDGQELQVQQGKSYVAFVPQEQQASVQYLNVQQHEAAVAEAAAAEAAAAEAAAAEAAAAEAAAAEAAAAEAAAAEAAAAAN